MTVCKNSTGDAESEEHIRKIMTTWILHWIAPSAEGCCTCYTGQARALIVWLLPLLCSPSLDYGPERNCRLVTTLSLTAGRKPPPTVPASGKFSVGDNQTHNAHSSEQYSTLQSIKSFHIWWPISYSSKPSQASLPSLIFDKTEGTGSSALLKPYIWSLLRLGLKRQSPGSTHSVSSAFPWLARSWGVKSGQPNQVCHSENQPVMGQGRA